MLKVQWRDLFLSGAICYLWSGKHLNWDAFRYKISRYRSPDLTRQFCCKGGSSCGFAYKHFLFVELQLLITHNCEGFHVSHVSSVSIQNWFIVTSFPCIFSPSLSSIHFTQKLGRRKCDWSLLSSVDQNAKPGPVIQLASYTRSSSNDPGIIQNSGIKPGSWWHWCSKSDQHCLGWQTWASRVCQEQGSCLWPWRSHPQGYLPCSVWS